MKILPKLQNVEVAQKGIGESIELHAIRKNILNLILLAASILGTLAYFSNIYTLIQNRSWVVAIIQTTVYVLLLLVTAFEKIGFSARVYGFLTIIFILGISDLLESGLSGEGRLFMLVFATMGLLLLNYRSGILIFVVSLISITCIAALMVVRIIPAPDLSVIDNSSHAVDWLTGGIIYVLMAALCLFSLYTLIQGLEHTVARQKQLTKDLEKERSGLEERVTERTSELEKHNNQLETASQFARAISVENSLTEILNQALDHFQKIWGDADLVIFLHDPKTGVYQIKSAAGEIGKALFEQQASLISTQPGTLGDLIQHGEAVILHNRGADVLYFNDLPISAMRLAVLLPFRASGNNIGAVFLLSQAELEINLNDLRIFQNMTDQLGTAVEKFRLLALMQENMAELKTSSRQLTQRNWRTYLKANQHKYSYRLDRNSLQTDMPEHAEVSQALQIGQRVVMPVETSEGSTSKGLVAVAIPIILRGQPLGVLNIRFNKSYVSEEMLNLVEAAAKRLAIALENIRLMDEVQKRAELEHTVSNISSKVRSTSDIDGILKVAALEIGRSLGVSEVLIQLRPEK
jgi:GAF domain-containing protein